MSLWNFNNRNNRHHENDNTNCSRNDCCDDKRDCDCGCRKDPCEDECPCDFDCCKCPPGPQGPAGPAGSDATVTADSIKTALGYTPADEKVVSRLSEDIGDIDTALDAILALQNSYIGGEG